uniref:Venom peptide n=1 Tax=Dasymutilla sicheliana TaxID=1175388 RepID=A0A8T9VRL5_DASSI|nr:venom peptide precursor [Dasymutilla sicheliana]UOY17205.1 venom peptide precursor [Dasymutilla sicheliana]UOY17206.1 venom peptide precursor [Dasymutilla sicheliana]
MSLKVISVALVIFYAGVAIVLAEANPDPEPEAAGPLIPRIG